MALTLTLTLVGWRPVCLTRPAAAADSPRVLSIPPVRPCARRGSCARPRTISSSPRHEASVRSRARYAPLPGCDVRRRSRRGPTAREAAVAGGGKAGRRPRTRAMCDRSTIMSSTNMPPQTMVRWLANWPTASKSVLAKWRQGPLPRGGIWSAAPAHTYRERSPCWNASRADRCYAAVDSRRPSHLQQA